MSAFGGIAEVATLSPLLPLLAYGDAFASGRLATREVLTHCSTVSPLAMPWSKLMEAWRPIASLKFQQCHSGA